MKTAFVVTPAKAGVQRNVNASRLWFPALAGMTRNGVSAPLFLDVARQLFACEHSRILDIGGEMFGRLWRRGHQAHPLERMEAVPRSLRDDDHHPGAQRVGF